MPAFPSQFVRPPSPPTRLPFCIRTLGRIRGQPYHVTAGTYHEDAMFTLVRAGGGRYHRAGEVQRLKPGHVGIVLPSDDTGLLMAEVNDPYDHYYCRFAGYEALRMARTITRMQRGKRFFECARWPEAMIIVEAMLAIEQGERSAPARWMSQAEAELARLLALLLSPTSSRGSRLSEPRLRQYMIDRISEPFELDRMARHFGVSRFGLSRRARAMLGEPLGAANRRMKLEFSRSLLDAGALELSIADVALRAGYQDPLYFSRLFRREFSISPSEYRSRARARRKS